MGKLTDTAQVIRSKNAGPLELTLDIRFGNTDEYDAAVRSPGLTAASVAARYGVTPDQVRVIHIAAARAIKINLPRPVVAGSPGDKDVYGAQQHRPLLEIEV